MRPNLFMKHALVNILNELRPSLRIVFVLRDIEGLPTVQTAQALNVSHTAVKARLWRARLQLRERLNQYFSKETESTCAELGPLSKLAGRIPSSCREGLFPLDIST